MARTLSQRESNMIDIYQKDAKALTEFLLEGHLAVSADAKLVAEAILLGFAYHADRVGESLSDGMNKDSIGAVLEEVLAGINQKRSE